MLKCVQIEIACRLPSEYFVCFGYAFTNRPFHRPSVPSDARIVRIYSEFRAKRLKNKGAQGEN